MKTLLRKFYRDSTRSRGARINSDRRAVRLALEHLEDRRVLSTTSAVEPMEPVDVPSDIEVVSRLREGGWINFEALPRTPWNHGDVVLLLDSGPFRSWLAANIDIQALFEPNGNGTLEVFGSGPSDNETHISREDLARIIMPITGPKEGGEVSLEAIVAQTHPAIPTAAGSIEAAAIAQGAVGPTSKPVASDFREISAARARDMAIEVAFMNSADLFRSNDESVEDAPNTRLSDIRWAIRPVVLDAESAAVAKQSVEADVEMEVPADQNQPDAESLMESVESLPQNGREFLEATVGEKVVNESSRPPGGLLESAENVSESGPPLRERENTIKPWHALVTLAAATVVAERLSKRRTETELHPSRQN